MAELLVRTFDKYEGTDKRRQARTCGRGDVIVVVPDGWQWSTIEKTNPQWVIVKVNAPLATCKALLSPEQGNVVVNPFLRIRQFNLNLDGLAALGKTIKTAAECKDLYDKKQNRPAESITVTEVEMLANKVTKPSVPNPAVIG